MLQEKGGYVETVQRHREVEVKARETKVKKAVRNDGLV